MPPQPLDVESQRSPATSSLRPSSMTAHAAFLISACMLLMIALLLWLYCHRKHVQIYLRRSRASQTSTPALLQKINPGDGTSVPIPVFMPTRRSRTPSQSMRQLFLPTSLGRANGAHQLHPGGSRSFRLPNRYFGGSTYPSLPPIPTPSNTFVEETANPAPNIPHYPLLPPGLVSTPLRVHLRPSE